MGVGLHLRNSARGEALSYNYRNAPDDLGRKILKSQSGWSVCPQRKVGTNLVGVVIAPAIVICWLRIPVWLTANGNRRCV